MIYDNPRSWKDLQNQVGTLLQECGFKVSVEKLMETVRGNVEVDVYAEETIDERNYRIVCECKHWGSTIPQTIVHAFRTVISDLGANIGYIITTSDFQSGSIGASEKTNIRLVSWSEFQSEFFESWYKCHFDKEIYRIIRSDYDPSVMQFFDDFSLIQRDQYRKLEKQYYALQEIKSHFQNKLTSNVLDNNRTIDDRLPLFDKLDEEVLDEWELFGIIIPNGLMQEKDYSNFLVLLEKFSMPIYAELDGLDLVMEYDN